MTGCANETKKTRKTEIREKRKIKNSKYRLTMIFSTRYMVLVQSRYRSTVFSSKSLTSAIPQTQKPIHKMV